MIIRRQHKRNFTTIANEAIEDTALSYEALGLLTYLISRPDNWEVRIEQLKARTKIGRDKLYRVAKELQEAGYLKHERVYVDGKVAFGRWIVMEEPETKEEQNSTPEGKNDVRPENPDEALRPENLHPENLESRKSGRLTKTQIQQKLREGAREREEGQTKPLVLKTPDDAGCEIAFNRLVAAYPPAAIDDLERARTLWADVPEAEWPDAADAVPRFLLARKSARRGIPIGLAKYIRDRVWQRFPQPASAKTEDPAIELAPFSRQIWALLWRDVERARATGEIRAQQNVGFRLKHVQQGLTTPQSAVPGAEELIALVPIVVGSPEWDLWAAHCERLGFTLPKPDSAAVIFAPSKEPDPLKLGWKGYRLAVPRACQYRDRMWWWRLHQIADGDTIEVQLREGGKSAGACKVELGPWPLAADIAGMVEIKQGSDAWYAWAKHFDLKGVFLSWPEPTIWCPGEYPPVVSGRERERVSA